MTFPALKPAVRTWTMGALPTSGFTTMSGHETRILLGSDEINTSLALQYLNIQETQVLELTAHYRTVRGGFDTFSLPAETFAGMADGAAVTPPGQVWRYASAPQIEWVSPGIATVSVELVAVLD